MQKLPAAITHLFIHQKILKEECCRCHECGKSFGCRSTLVQRQRIRTGERPYKCNECCKTFNQRAHLNQHERIHTGERPYECKECRKTFSQMTHLSITVHQRIHSGEKPYKYKDCGRAFTQSAQLIRHQEIHSREKPYECSKCKKSFICLSSLIEHQRVHTGEKPYQCTDCKKTFCHIMQLTLHWRIHTGEKPYECKECGRAFTYMSHFVIQRRSHRGERPYECHVCGKTTQEENHAPTDRLAGRTRSHSTLTRTQRRLEKPPVGAPREPAAAPSSRTCHQARTLRRSGSSSRFLQPKGTPPTKPRPAPRPSGSSPLHRPPREMRLPHVRTPGVGACGPSGERGGFRAEAVGCSRGSAVGARGPGRAGEAGRPDSGGVVPARTPRRSLPRADYISQKSARRGAVLRSEGRVCGAAAAAGGAGGRLGRGECGEGACTAGWTREAGERQGSAGSVRGSGAPVRGRWELVC
uniref:LOW QUALITY PROTEIN: zinc finger protein 92 homolog n=1 Tax=Odobenus rosmarus divergens TaxID=9708 RepID=UPI00063CE21E|nr:PREDICTED: LOW QUALITY PROTEIN: zinc finger protein 92 homolog [Odobenus rosmarus divergens]